MQLDIPRADAEALLRFVQSLDVNANGSERPVRKKPSGKRTGSAG